MQSNFLVVSVDSDEQQFFYDVVRAEDAEEAAALICKLRPYVVDADASSVEQVAQMAKQTKSAKPKAIQKRRDEVAVESAFTARCDNCGEVYQQDDLDDIRRYHERVAEGEEEPVGQCPSADCGALCHLIPGA